MIYLEGANWFMAKQRLKRVVHFGTGRLIAGTPLGKPVEFNEIHYSLDIDPLVHEQYKTYLKQKRIKRGSVFRLGSAEETGLRGNSVDEIHMHNLLCSKPFTEKERRNIFAEAKRILKPGAPIIIGHTNTPGVFPKERLGEEARKHGFDMEMLVEDLRNQVQEKIPRENLAQLTACLGPAFSREEIIHPGYYVALLRKKKE